MSQKIEQGDQVPAFQLPDQTGETFDSKTLHGKKHVIFFYPKDETPGCTKEACSFRDSYQDFQAAGAEVIGISSDEIRSHQSFISNHNLPYTLLSDTEKKVRKKFGVPGSLFGLLPGRVTYIVDSNGTVQHVFNSQLNSEGHVKKAIEIVNQIN